MEDQGIRLSAYLSTALRFLEVDDQQTLTDLVDAVKAVEDLWPLPQANSQQIRSLIQLGGALRFTYAVLNRSREKTYNDPNRANWDRNIITQQLVKDGIKAIGKLQKRASE
jgi:hypothetical protein